MSAPPPPNNSHLTEDPDDRIGRWGWFLWWTWLVVGGVLTARAAREGGLASIVVVLLAPFWGAWLLWLVLRGGRWAREWLAASVWGEWNGAYFEYDGRQTRVLFAGDDVFIAAADVFSACGIQNRGRDIARARLIAGREGIVPAPGTSLLCFTERGLRAWMERRSDQQSGKFMLWFERTVINPYRRRREMGYPTPEREGAAEEFDRPGE